MRAPPLRLCVLRQPRFVRLLSLSLLPAFLLTRPLAAVVQNKVCRISEVIEIKRKSGEALATSPLQEDTFHPRGIEHEFCCVLYAP